MAEWLRCRGDRRTGGTFGCRAPRGAAGSEARGAAAAGRLGEPSTEEACRYQPWGPNTPAETQAFAEDAVAAWRGEPQSRYVWIAEEAAVVVGLGELKIRSRRWKQGEIAYAVNVGQWQRGIGSAIATVLLTRAFGSFRLHRVAATCDPRNQASAAVLARVGMVHEGRLRHTIQIRDGWRDSDVYSVLAHEWDPPSPLR